MDLTAADRQINDAMGVFKTLWPYDDGPGHIVYADFNMRSSDIEWCIDQIEQGSGYSDDYPDTTHPIHRATKAVLEYLLEISEEDRLTWAEDPYSRLYGSYGG